jgi:hypothetical protein
VIDDQPFFVSIQMLDDLGKFIGILNGISHEKDRNSIVEFVNKMKKNCWAIKSFGNK